MSKQKEVQVKFVSNSKDIIKDTKKVKEGVDEVAKSTENVGTTGGKSFGKLKGGLNKVKGGFRAVGTAIKASGIGLLVTVIGSIVKGFQRSEKSQILFAKLMNNINAVLQPALDLITGLVEGVLEFVTSGEKLSQFATNFKNFVIDRVNTALGIFKSLGAAIKDLVTGDFEGALENAKKAGKSYIDLTIGTLSKGAKAVTDAVKNSAKEFGDQVKANRADLERLNELEGTIFQKKRDRELQIAELRKESEEARFRAEDASNKNLEERFKAQDDALAAEQKIADLRIAQANDELELLRLKNAQGDSSREDKEAELQLELEILAAQQEKASRQKEVRNQQVSLRQQQEAELKAIREQEKADEEAEREAERVRKEEEHKLELARIDEKKQAEKDLANEKKQLQEDFMNSVIALAGHESRVAKAIHIFKMGMKLKEVLFEGKKKAAEGVTSLAEGGVEATKANLKAVGTLNPAVITATKIATSLGLVANIAAVAKQMTASKKLAALGGGSANGSVSSASRPAPPAFNVIGATSADSNLIADSIDSKNNEPVKAYVVESEISAKQKAINEARKLRTL